MMNTRSFLDFMATERHRSSQKDFSQYRRSHAVMSCWAQRSIFPDPLIDPSLRSGWHGYWIWRHSVTSALLRFFFLWQGSWILYSSGQNVAS